MKIPVRKLFWEALEMALETQTHRLAKDIAAVLGEPDAPLLKALRDEKVSALLFDEAADEDIDDLADHRCQHFTAAGPFWRRCGEPVLWSSGPDRLLNACLYHSMHPCLAVPGPVVYSVATDTDEPLYVNQESKAVYTVTGNLCGRLSDDGKQILLFEICG